MALLALQDGQHFSYKKLCFKKNYNWTISIALLITTDEININRSSASKRIKLDHIHGITGI